MKLVVRAMTLALLMVLPVAPAHAQTALPDVDVVLIAEIEDPVAWAGLYQEVLGTPGSAIKPLRAVLPAGTGGSRWITIDEPKFTASVVAGQGRSVVKVGITGRIRAAEALASLTAFELAALDVQAGAIPNVINLLYGLSGANGQLIELHLSRS